MANTIYIIINPTIIPYKTPPNLSNCLIIGSSANDSARVFNSINSILVTINKPIVTIIYTELIAIESATETTAVFFAFEIAFCAYFSMYLSTF